MKRIGGTDIAGAIITSTNLLSTTEKGKEIFLIGDGSDTAKTFVDRSVDQSIEYAQKNQVVIHTIGLGSEEGLAGYVPDTYNISTTYNEDNLKRISNETGGIFFNVKGLEDFEGPYNELIKETKRGMIPFRFNRIAIGLALLLLFIEWIFMNTKFRKIP